MGLAIVAHQGIEPAAATPVAPGVKLKALVGSGDRIGLATAPVLLIGMVLNVAYPAPFSVGGPPRWLRAISAAILTVGIVGWLWSAGLILARVPRGELITGGPYAVVKHPLYTSVALLVLPWLGFLLDTGWGRWWGPRSIWRRRGSRPRKRPSWPRDSVPPGTPTVPG